MAALDTPTGDRGGAGNALSANTSQRGSGARVAQPVNDTAKIGNATTYPILVARFLWAVARGIFHNWYFQGALFVSCFGALAAFWGIIGEPFLSGLMAGFAFAAQALMAREYFVWRRR